jgi:hypothetical protein
MPQTASNVELAHRIQEYARSGGAGAFAVAFLLRGAAPCEIATFPRA